MNKVLILDFGSQYTQLIARKVRELQVYSEIHPFNYPLEKIIADPDIKAVILSGGPASIYGKDAPHCDSGVFDLEMPLLGICYGLQHIAYSLGGKVDPAESREYGRARLIVDKHDDLLANYPADSQVWMSHGDHLTELPSGFEVIGHTTNSPIAAVRNLEKQIYGIQFHPEVYHTTDGKTVLQNFLFNICRLSPDWSSRSFIEAAIEKIKRTVGDKKVICGLSGGVDSSVAAVLLHQALGDNLTCIFVDHGMLRHNEALEVETLFRQKLNLNLICVTAADLFLSRLSGVVDPERKRKIIGEAFIDIFEKEAKKLGQIDFLAQGTLYPDVIESVSFKGPSVTIKSHTTMLVACQKE